jgi:hypothetical protein
MMNVKLSNILLFLILHTLLLPYSIESSLIFNNQNHVELKECAICYEKKNTDIYTFERHPDVVCSHCLNEHKEQFQDPNVVSCPWCREIIHLKENDTMITCKTPPQNEPARRVGTQEQAPSAEQLRNMGIPEVEINYNLRINNEYNGNHRQNIPANRRNVRSFQDRFRSYKEQFYRKSCSEQLIDMAKLAAISTFLFYITSRIGHSILKCKSYISKIGKRIQKYIRAPVQHRRLKGIRSLF